MLRIAGLLLLCLVLLSAHPVDEFTPKPASASTIFGDPLVIDDIGEIKFDFQFPDATALDREELYMLAGATETNGDAVRPWWSEVMYAAITYHHHKGVWPSSITDEVIDALAGKGEAPKLRARLVSPISGRYPRLDASSFSPGDLYMRRLTDAEYEFAASQSETLRKLVDKSDLAGNPIYVRVYGRTQVVAARCVVIGAVAGH